MSTAELPSWAGQDDYDVRFQWGPVAATAMTGGTCVVVDVLRFATAVEAAATRGVAVYPFRWSDARAAGFAESVRAVLPPRGPGGLSPLSMETLAPGTSLVLPSPNGSACAALAGQAGARVAAGCLRNAAAVGEWAGQGPRPVTVIACGERWPDGSLRPSLEDLLGAGAVLAHVAGTVSPEARAAIAAFRDAEPDLPGILRQCASGRESSERGRDEDLAYASRLNVSTVVPVLANGAFRPARPLADAGAADHDSGWPGQHGGILARVATDTTPARVAEAPRTVPESARGKGSAAGQEDYVGVTAAAGEDGDFQGLHPGEP